MIYDRPYMNSLPRATPMLKYILMANMVVFVLQGIVFFWVGSNAMTEVFALSGEAVSKGYVWTLLSYSLLHGNIWHLLLNMLLVYFMGSIVEEVEGPKRFLYIYCCATVLGGLFWLAFHHAYPHHLIGASAASLGLLIYFCFYQPDRPITLLLFFVLPITLKPKWVAWAVLAMDLFGFCFQELRQEAYFANSAHLGGMLAGFLCYRIFQGAGNVSLKGWADGSEGPAHWIKRKTSKVFSKATFSVNISPQSKEDISAEVDRILDKINDKGFGALSDAEKKMLDRAKDDLKR